MSPRLTALPLLCAAALTLSACDEIAIATSTDDPEARIAARGARSCVRAVENHTDPTAAEINTTIPVIEVNRFIVDVPGPESPWVCITDDEGNAREIVLFRG